MAILNMLFWWAAALASLFYLRKIALAVENASLAAIGALRDLADGDYDGGHEGMTGGNPIPRLEDEDPIAASYNPGARSYQ